MTPEQKIAKRLAAYDDSIGLIYRFTKLAQLPKPKLSQRILEGYQQHDEDGNEIGYGFEKAGVAFIGSPRLGKSRTAQMFVRDRVKDFQRARYISAVKWAAEASRRAKDCELDGWVSQLCLDPEGEWCDYLMIDDIDKVKATTPTVPCELYNLIEEATSNEVALVITTNAKGEKLMRKFGEYGEAIVGRINDFCTIWDFD